MATRLERLFVLLESGTSAVTRRAAARQLGDVQRAHPHELHRLLAKITQYLKSNTWETRIAAGQAVEAILSNVPQWDPTPCIKGVKIEDSEIFNEKLLSFDTFELENILEHGAYLLGSEGKEYNDIQDDTTDLKDKIEKQKNALNAKLGLDVACKLGIDVNEIYSDEDLLCNNMQPTNTKNDNKKSLSDLVYGEGLSSREKNRARRLARQAFGKQRSRDEEQADDPPCKVAKTEVEVDAPDEPVPNRDGGWSEDSIHWPLCWWWQNMCKLLLAPVWEIRHGAATAIREALRLHAKALGRSRILHEELMDERNQAWLEDISLRLLIVLVLDKFGDFVSDQVVAPVRETCAQALGVCSAVLDASRASKLLHLVCVAGKHHQWEARHGSVLALKYLVASRDDVWPEASVALRVLLEDGVEDVAGGAAGALAQAVARGRQPPPSLLVPLWARLAALDDLDAAAHHYLELLAALLTTQHEGGINLKEVLPRLWPFLDHVTSAVRKATVKTLVILTRPLNSSTDTNLVQQNDHNYHIVAKPRDTVEAVLKAVRLSIKDDENYYLWKGPDWEKLDNGPKLDWSPELLQEAMRYVYQRILLEQSPEIQNLAEEVWVNLLVYSSLEILLLAACPLVSMWLCLAMQPTRVPIDQECLITPNNVKSRMDSTSDGRPSTSSIQRTHIASSASSDENHVTKTRLRLANIIGLLARYIVKPAPGIHYTESPIDSYIKVIEVHACSVNAMQRFVCGASISAWAICDSNSAALALSLLEPTLHRSLLSPPYYDHLAHSVNRILLESSDLIAMLKHYKLPVESDEFTHVHSLEQVINIMNSTEPMIKTLKQKRVQQSLDERRHNILTNAVQMAEEHTSISIGVESELAGSCAWLGAWGERVNPILRPLMESVKRSSNVELQSRATLALPRAVNRLAELPHAPHHKLLNNLKHLLACDLEHSPNIILGETIEISIDNEIHFKNTTPLATTTTGIYTVLKDSMTMHTSTKSSKDTEKTKNEQLLSLQRRGAELALISITKYYSDDLPHKLPKLWEFIMEPLTKDFTDTELLLCEEETASELVSRLLVCEACCSWLGPACKGRTVVVPPRRLLQHNYTVVRHIAARVWAALASSSPGPVMRNAVLHVMPALQAQCDKTRCGAIETIALIVQRLNLKIVPYIAILVLPVMGCMSDYLEPVRLMAARCFATLVQLMPLDGAIPDPDDLSEEVKAKKLEDKRFLDQLFNPKCIKDFKLPFTLNAELRSYQQAGINWLRFLREYGLHGVLCDDMGLGKTLQSICTIASDHFLNKDIEPTLVLCPPTLTGHWVYEVRKFVPMSILKPLHYCGLPSEREKLRTEVKKHNLVVASYDILRKDIVFFRSLKWNYCVLDEGHIIKNGKTKVFKAIKMLVANHRLILTGTPIQNNVLELWTLFDFLMPGLLGSEREFTIKYSRPILLARDPKATQQQHQASAVAIEALHRQVLPFLLRRVKEDVLKELPPKITQDYYCELSPLQRRLYEDFSKSQFGDDNIKTTHVFEALRYLQSVCNHPKLVLKNNHPEYNDIMVQLNQDNSSLNHIEHAAKLPALKQLLEDCGIGSQSADQDIVSQHRALIFCQQKSMLEIVENDLLKKHLPSVSYLRLDGSVPAAQRHSIVTRFNDDVSIDVLLLTTKVGGLGVNLTGADTVIFVEHSWNPCADLQAMDRAHRIGQTRSVNVYRLITRDTLEEKIMNLQKFKMKTAKTIISEENSSMETMKTDQLFDLFNISNMKEGQSCTSGNAGSSSGLKSALESLPDLWDHTQYEEEYDMGNFIEGLQKINK